MHNICNPILAWKLTPSVRNHRPQLRRAGLVKRRAIVAPSESHATNGSFPNVADSRRTAALYEGFAATLVESGQFAALSQDAADNTGCWLPMVNGLCENDVGGSHLCSKARAPRTVAPIPKDLPTLTWIEVVVLAS